jgi:hypothetical protein
VSTRLTWSKKANLSTVQTENAKNHSFKTSALQNQGFKTRASKPGLHDQGLRIKSAKKYGDQPRITT